MYIDLPNSRWLLRCLQDPKHKREWPEETTDILLNWVLMGSLYPKEIELMPKIQHMILQYADTGRKKKIMYRPVTLVSPEPVLNIRILITKCHVALSDI